MEKYDHITFHLEKLAKKLYPLREGHYSYKAKNGDYVFGVTGKRIQIPEEVAKLLAFNN